MPNFQATCIEKLTYPSSSNGVEFLWEANESNETLIYTRYKEEEFFLKRLQRGDDVLIKGEKITRPSQVKLLQYALAEYEKVTNSKTTYSNIHTTKNRHDKDSKHLKNIDFFVNEFDDDREIWVEVGFGSGRHLLYQASQNPNVLHVGIEIHKPSVEQVMKRCEAEGLDNVYLLDFDARIFLECLESNKVGRIFVHFPVPWDKKPHRRVISKAFINESIRVLKIGGSLELRTDSDNYFGYSFGEFIALNKAKLAINKNQELPITSKYEDRWKKMEKNIYDITLINDVVSEDIELPKPLCFEKSLHVKNIKENFTKDTLRGDSWFVHFEQLYTIDDETIMLRVSFGANERGEHNFILIEGEKALYFPKKVLSTEANVWAHRAIEDWLETCSKK